MFFRQVSEKVAGSNIAADATAVHIAEYQALRQEVNNRQTLSNALIAADVTALGVGISAARQYPAILIALGVISSLFWLFWLVQTLQIYRIAAYVALKLRPCLTESYKCRLLGWEAFVRRLTFSPAEATRALYAGSKFKPRNITRNVDGIYISLLLGGATPLLLAASAGAAIHHGSRALPWKVEIAASLILWLYALIKAIHTLRTTREISRLIIESDSEC